MAIGARSQSAKTYLEKKFEHFEEASLEALIKEGLAALAETISSSDEVGLTSKNTSVGIVGLDQKFHVLEGAQLQPYLEGLERKQGSMDTDVIV